MGETPKSPYGWQLTQPARTLVSALADAFPGVALLERPAVVRIEAVAARSLLLADHRCGLLRGRSRWRRETRGLVSLLGLLLTPAKPFGEPHDLASRNAIKSTGSFLLVTRRITRARARGNTQSRELRGRSHYSCLLYTS